MAQTSDRVSAIASRYLTVTPDQLMGMAAMENSRKRLAEDIRSMAASLLRQDEVKGVRGFIKKVLGK